MLADSGTPTKWLCELSDHLVHVHCACAPEIAAKRFLERQRHPGHLDGAKSYAEVLAGIRALARLEPIEIGPRVTVDTSEEPRLDDIVRDIRKCLGDRCRGSR
jgi:hypothetical protein